MKKLLIDAGNTRIKWAMASDIAELKCASLPTQQVAELASHWADLPDECEVFLSNVAGTAVAQQIETICRARNWPLKIISAQAENCGVKNHYQQPAQLGSDRWAALIAAWHSARAACLVVNCGTATTIDALFNEGDFLGGLILPGLNLMQLSLTNTTAQLRDTAGEHQDFPRNTADAIFSGAIQASCGAILLQHQRLGVKNAPIILSGGAAPQLLTELKRINLPIRIVDNLVLQGLLLIAQEMNA